MTSIWLTLKQHLALSHVHQMPTHLVPFSGEKMGYLAPLLTTQNPTQLHWTLSTVRNPSTVKELVNCTGTCQLYRNLSTLQEPVNCIGTCQLYRALSSIQDPVHNTWLCQQQCTGACQLHSAMSAVYRTMSTGQESSSTVLESLSIVQETLSLSMRPRQLCRKTFGIWAGNFGTGNLVYWAEKNLLFERETMSALHGNLSSLLECWKPIGHCAGNPAICAETSSTVQ
jgi:hypothetical protein